MTNRRRGTQHQCHRARPSGHELQHPEQSAFVLVFFMADHGTRPTEDDLDERCDRFYACGDASVCGCPPDHANRQWKVRSASLGGIFEGRLTGQASITYDWPRLYRAVITGSDDPDMARAQLNEAQARRWERNSVRPLDMKGPPSAFAVLTPDGLWNECVEPEPHDLIVGRHKDGQWAHFVDPTRELTKLQVAWRFAVAEMLMRYQHCWLVGVDAELSSLPARKCRVP